MKNVIASAVLALMVMVGITTTQATQVDSDSAVISINEEQFAY